MVSFKHKENNELPKLVVCCCDLFFWSSDKDFHQKSDMIGHAVFCLILPLARKTNDKSRTMTPCSEPGSQLASSFLILVQRFSLKVRYDWSCRFLSYFTFCNENQWKTMKNDARQRARQPAWELISDPRTRIFSKSQIWLVMPFFVLFYLLQWKPMKNQEKWRHAASQAASLRALFWSSYKDFHKKSDITGHAVFCFILFFTMKTNENYDKWRQTASQAASLRAHFWSSYKEFH